MADVLANWMLCHARVTCHTAGCCHLVNSLSWFKSHMPHCRVQSPGEIKCHDGVTLQGVRILSAILEFYFWFRFRHIAAVDRSFCTSLRNFIQIGPPSAEKLTSCRVSRRRISAILDFMGQIMGSLKSACTTSYRSSIKCLVFEKIVFLHFADREIDRRTDEQPVAWSRSRCRERRLKKPSCRRETARCFVSLNISLSHSRSLTVIRNDILE